MARILIGVPLFRVPEIAHFCLRSLVGRGADVLVIDNAADADVKQVINRFSVEVIKSPVNTFCNGGWNLIMEYGLKNEYDIIGLSSSDVILAPNWCDILRARAENHTDEVWIPALEDSPEVTIAQNVAGFTSFLPRAAVESVYPIPAELRHWFGDQYMFEKLRREGWKVAVLGNLRATHEWSAVTSKTPEAYSVIEQDKIAWRAYENRRISVQR